MTNEDRIMLLKKIMFALLGHSQTFEVMLRCFFESNSLIKNYAQKIYKKKNKNKKNNTAPGAWNAYKETIINNGIQKGDIILVHSAMGSLSKLGISPKQMIDFLLELIGLEGTLVFPTYPVRKLIEENVYLYDVKKTDSWTGLLTSVFLNEYSDVKRSAFPLNTLAAKGKEADTIVKDNLKGEYSQGKYSSWQYCINRNMKILFLGVKACTCNTFIHYPEDILEKNWPIKDFFVQEKFKIIEADGQVTYKTIQERDLYWFRYFTMFYTGTWLKKNKYLEEYDVNGVYFGIIKETKKLAERIIDMAKNNEIFFKIPKKYWK